MTRILIADPNWDSRKALSLLLSHRLGIAGIDEAGDTETLIRSLSKYPYDLLLLDWDLYGAPGPETCCLLHKAYPALKVILLSVNTDDGPAARGAGAGFIHKGASPDDVLAILEPMLMVGK